MSNTPQTLKDGAIALVIALFLIALGALGAYFPLKRHFQAKLEALKPEVVQVVTERLDTAKFAPKEPIEKDVIKYIRIPVADSSAIESLIRDKDALLADVARLERNNDSLVLVLKREQKVYADSSYRAVVSGISPQLDSIEVYNKTIMETKIVTQKQFRKFDYGVQVGNGLVCPVNSTPNFGWYVGFGLTYHF